MADLRVKIGKLELKNPVILASGTCGFGEEIKDLIDIKKLGAIVTKTITPNKREGNPPPRVSETASGLLNSIGLDNDGLKDCNDFDSTVHPGAVEYCFDAVDNDCDFLTDGDDPDCPDPPQEDD